METGTTISQTTSLPPSASVAAVHYGHIVGESWDQDNTTQRTPNMSIYVFGNKSSTMTRERILIDSGAQCCVCPSDYAPDVEISQIKDAHLPGLHSGTGENMTVLGVKTVS